MKHPRKRQKRTGSVDLELFHDDANKDEEEKRLETSLFGKSFQPGVVDVDVDGDEALDYDGGAEMENLLDEDLFFVDDGEPSAPRTNDVPTSSNSNSDSEGSNSNSDSEDEDDPKKLLNTLSKTGKKAAWIDTSDLPSVSLSHSRHRKLRDSVAETSLPGREYESRLRRQFERINPEPVWAAKARKARRKREHENSTEHVDEEGAEGDPEALSRLLNSTSGILSQDARTKRGRRALPSGSLAIQRLRDVNQDAQASNCGAVKALAFHPSEKVPVLCVGTADRRVRLYNVDGHTSPHILTLHIPSLPLTRQSSTTFHPGGAHLLLSGSRPFFMSYDLQKGKMTTINGPASNLWSDTVDTPVSKKRRKPNRADSDSNGGNGESSTANATAAAAGGGSMDINAFSPDGSILAVASRNGYIHLLDWRTFGTGQVIGSLKCTTPGGGIKDMWWSPTTTPPTPTTATATAATPTTSTSGSYLTVLTGDAEVYVWDVGERKCVKRWRDFGGFRGSGRVGVGAGGFVAIGSNSGLVNMYSATTLTPSASSSLSPSPVASYDPIKTLKHLTTPISTLRINPFGSLLAVASNQKKDAMRLIHLPTLSAFPNWPTSSTPLGYVTAVDFSRGSEFVVVGNGRGRVLCFGLRDYVVGG